MRILVHSILLAGAVALLCVTCDTAKRKELGGSPAKATSSAGDVAVNPFVQTQDIAIAGVDGKPFHLDIFTPTGVRNGRAIIDVASGAWYSNRAKINEHKMAQLYWHLCSHGYMVFAVRPGSQPQYTAEDMVQNLKTAIRWVKAHALEYGFEADQVGITGASAGGHLALLTAVTPEAAQPDAQDLLARQDTHLAAVGVFFPPTDFLNWDGSVGNLRLIGPILFRDGLKSHSKEEQLAQAARISPARRIGEGPLPPFLLIHGSADPVVPLQQSELMTEVIRKAGGQAELLVKEGGGHPWLTIPEEVAKLSGWFDKVLRVPVASARLP